MPNFSRRLTARLRHLFMRPLRHVAAVIDRRADVVLTTILRRELASDERKSRQSDLVLEAFLREVVAAIDNAGRESRQRDSGFDAALREVVAAIDNAGRESRQRDLVLEASLRQVLAAIDNPGGESRQRDLVLETVLREVVATVENAGRELRQSDLVLDALLREVVRLQNLVEDILARHDQIEEETEVVATAIPIRERSA